MSIRKCFAAKGRRSKETREILQESLSVAFEA